MAYLSEVSAEQLELVASALKVIRTVRVKKACTKCDGIVEAPAPSRPVERGIAGPGLLARVLTAKYCEHLPLYRQTEILARQGVELSRALLSNWVDTCCRLMAPLDEALYHYVMNCRKLHTDDTPVPVLAPGGLMALVEDVVTTGGTLIKVIERVENEGFRVGLVATIVDRPEGGAATLAAAGYPLRAVFTREQLIGRPGVRP